MGGCSVLTSSSSQRPKFSRTHCEKLISSAANFTCALRRISRGTSAFMGTGADATIKTLLACTCELRTTGAIECRRNFKKSLATNYLAAKSHYNYTPLSSSYQILRPNISPRIHLRCQATAPRCHLPAQLSYTCCTGFPPRASYRCFTLTPNGIRLI